MSVNRSSTGQDGATAAELRRKAQELVRSSVAAADPNGREGRRWVRPVAAAAVVAAAACVPVVWPLLPLAAAGGGAAALGAAFAQVGGVGGGLLSEAVIRAWDRMRSRGQSDQGQTGLRDALAEDLEARLTLDTSAAAALRGEVAAVLRGVDAVQVAMTATVKESAAGVRDVLVQGLRELGSEFSEFGWMLAEVNHQLTVIAEDVAQAAAASRETADSQQQVLVELALLRQEARAGFRSPSPDVHLSAGPSTDEERAAALDAAGVPVSTDCPYPGLAAFRPQDAERFFGREQLTAVLVARAGELLTQPGLLMVLGPSGSGKSSLLGAGLLPMIAAGSLPARGSSAWPRDLMTPGRRPLMELATRIASLARIPAGALEADLRTDPSRITGAIRQALLANTRRQENVADYTSTANVEAVGRPGEEPGGDLGAAEQQGDAEPRLILIVDQFEEVFTQCGDDRERHAFITALCSAAGVARRDVPSQGSGRVHVDAREAPAVVVIGIRADFYASAAAYPELIPHLQGRQVIVGPIDEAGLREAIEKPASTAGLVVDAALVEVLLADLGIHSHPEKAPAGTAADSRAEAEPADSGDYGAGRLALLSYALQQTWRNREGRRLTVAGYRATGGIDEAVAQAADNVYDKLDDSGQDTLKRTLLRLVTLGEGTADTRRRVARSEFTGSGNTAPAALTRAVLDDMIEARLVTTDADTVEITHETLLTAWPRLRRWLTEDRAGLRIHQDLTEAAHDWQQTSRDPSHLFRGTRLAVAKDWAAHHDQDLNADERAFLDASQHEQRRATRLRHSAVAALAALALVASGLAVTAAVQYHRAVRERDQAIFNQVSAEAASLASTNPSLSADFNLAAYRMEQTQTLYTSLINTEASGLATPLALPAKPFGDFAFGDLAFSPSGRVLAGAGGRTIRLWDTTDPERPVPLGQPLGVAAIVNTVSISPDGRTLTAGLSDGTVRMWNIADPAQPHAIGEPLRIPSASAGVWAAFDPRGHVLLVLVVSGNRSSFLQFWNVSRPTSPEYLSALMPCTFIDTLAVSTDGDRAAVGCTDGTVHLADITDPARPQAQGRIQASSNSMTAVNFSQDGRTLVSASYSDQSFSLWNVADPWSPAELGTPNYLNNGIYDVSMSPDSPVLATADHDGTVQLWNIADPTVPDDLGPAMTADAGPAVKVAFSPDGQTVAVAYVDGAIRLWNIPHPLVIANGYGTTDGIAFSADGRLLAASNDESDTLNLWEITGRTPPQRASSPAVCANGKIQGTELIAFAPRSPVLAAGCYGGFRLWDVADPLRVTALSPWLASTPENSWVNSVAFDHNGKLLAATGNDYVTLWNVADPARPAKIGTLSTGAPGSNWTVASISPDGRTLAVSAGTTVQLWNITNPAEPHLIAGPLPGPTQWVTYITFSQNGDILAAASADDNIYLWNTAGPHPGTPLETLTGHSDLVTSVAFSPDDSMLASSSYDDTVRLWNTAPAGPLGEPLTGHTGYALAVAFSPVGHTLASIGNDDTVYLWDLNVHDAISRICAATAGMLTPSQWHHDLPGVPYAPPCPAQ